MNDPGPVIVERPICCGRPTVDVNCFDHRAWLCLTCRKKLGRAPDREPEWETMTIGGTKDGGR